MRNIVIYISACVLAAIVPFISGKSEFREERIAFPGWPRQFEGINLERLPLSEREERFAQGFPGRIARFRGGRQEIIIRWVTKATRKLHPASDCFKGLGYTIDPGPVWVDQNGVLWRYFEASKTDKFHVLERIYDDTGNSWTDVSAWYWTALLGKSDGPWWTITIAEQQQE